MGAAATVASKPADASDIQDLTAANAEIKNMCKALAESENEDAITVLNGRTADDEDLETLEAAKKELSRLRGLATSLMEPPECSGSIAVSGKSLALTDATVDLMAVTDEDGVQGGLLKLGLGQLTSLPPALFAVDGIRVLNVRGNQIGSIGPEISKLVWLTELNISENGLAALPGELGMLKRLQSIDCSDNKLITLPDELGGCVALQCFIAFKNMLMGLPTTMARCTQLKEVNFFNNKLKKIPDSWQELTQLEDVNFGSNAKLKYLPDTTKWTKLTRLAVQWCGLNNVFWNMKSVFSFESLGSLEMLQMDRNTGLSELPKMGDMSNMGELILPSMKALASLPDQIGTATSLTRLDASSCALTTLPKDIGNCIQLQILNVGGNKLESLPTELGNCNQMVTLLCFGNKLTKIPGSLKNCVALTRANFKGCPLDGSDSDTQAVVEQMKTQCGNKFVV